MKRSMLIVASLLFAASVANANPSPNMDFTTMNKADSQFLFEGSASAIALNEQELEETEGQWLPVFWALSFGWGAGAYLNAPTNGGFTYSRWPNQRRTWVGW